MATKTDLILSYLPGTFRALPKPTALYAVVDAFGNELLLAENSLAAIMLAHWVDHADRGADEIGDLAKIAALYGLAPRKDETTGEILESVEEFREHLKRYIRTFLEGTVTVQGILRVTAEVLGLHIDDAHLDRWWKRKQPELVTIELRGDDAAELVLGVKAATAVGSSEHPAQVKGTTDLSADVDLRGASILRLKIDSANPVDIDLGVGDGVDPASVRLSQIRTKINQILNATVASGEVDFLSLASPTIGPVSRLEVQDVAHDAAERILGLRPRTYRGSEARAAQVKGTIDLSNGIDFGKTRYLRLEIDGTHLAEIDCGGTNPGPRSLDQIRDEINQALGPNVASHDAHFLTLTSPTQGFNSRIAFLQPAAGDATALLFDKINPFYAGQDVQPARVIGSRELTKGVDLSDRANLCLRIDGAASLTINCAGNNPPNTQPDEIVTAINTAFRTQVASFDGRSIALTSPTTGPTSEITFETLLTGEAMEAILGIGSRRFQGAAATAARMESITDLSVNGGINLMARHVLSIAVDGGSPIEVDLRMGVTDARHVSPHELAEAINRVLDPDIASSDGQHLILTSPTRGSASSLAIAPLETTCRRRFVTRAIVTDEATQSIFGFMVREATGTPGTSARIVGTADLIRGVDLREARYLKIKVDGHDPCELDCAASSQRPRAALLSEIVEAIDRQLGSGIASQVGGRLVLKSPTTGTSSRLAFEPPQDALDKLLGIQPTAVRGQDATGVSFVGTINLSAGIDLPSNAAIKIGIDGTEPIQIPLTGSEPVRKTLGDIAIAINESLPDVASQDGIHLILTSPLKGIASRLAFAVPSATDVTAAIFGITPPRSYQGTNATPAQVIGTPELSGNLNLRIARYLRIAVDGDPFVGVDCVPQGADPAAVTLEQIVAAINSVLPGVATAEGNRLKLTSRTPGLAGQIALEPYTAGDARQLLLKEAVNEVRGTDPAPAVLKGDADLLAPVNLSQRRLIRLAVDGGRPVDIDVIGADPAVTFLDEIVVAINRVLPGVAIATEDDRLQLTSPTAREGSHLSVLPLRYLEVLEYPPKPAQTSSPPVRHGDRWSVVNNGAADVLAKVELAPSQGAAGLTLVNLTLGWQVRLLTSLRVGEKAQLWHDPKLGLQVAILSAEGQSRPVPSSQILVGPVGTQIWVPFAQTRDLSSDADGSGALQLNNALAPRIVRLRAKSIDPPCNRIAVSVTESDFNAIHWDIPAGDRVGRIRIVEGVFQLVDANDAAIANLRAGPGVDLAAHRDRVVTVTGVLHTGAPPLLIVQEVVPLFDVTLHSQPEGGQPIDEHYIGVTIGAGVGAPYSLVRQIMTGSLAVASASRQASELVKAEELDKASILSLPQGKSDWLYLECYGSRFNQARFNYDCFAGSFCRDRGVFNVSRFTSKPKPPEQPPPESIAAVFASPGAATGPTAQVTFSWDNHQPGAFCVNLPADLPARFGARFNEARFSQGLDKQKKIKAEFYPNAVTEPVSDPNYLIALIKAKSTSIEKSEAKVVPRVPIGWEAAKMPFRQPKFLTLGTENLPARIYLTEEGFDGFIELQASEVGIWGNEIAVSARKSGPATYDVSISYPGARFECARQVVLGPPLPALVQENLKPVSVGILQAKAAGVHADVTRDRCD
jgi:hypothetical protein